jgi:PAS domain S-box-containing protein
MIKTMQVVKYIEKQGVWGFMFLSLFISIELEAQRYNFSNFTIAQGLTNNQVTSIMQDDLGYLWVGTAYGLCRFNGIQFLKFEPENPVSYNTIKAIYQDKEGRVWVGMLRKGVAVFSGVSFNYFNSRHGLLNDNINAIVQDNNGRMWFGTPDGISIYDGKTFTNLTTSNGLCDNYITDLKKAKDGSIWISTLNGVSRWQADSITGFYADNGLKSSVVYHIFIADNGKIYFSTQRGLSVYDGKSFNSFSDLIPDDRIQACLIDYSGLVYVISYGQGVFLFRDSSMKHLTVADGLPGNVILSAYSDKENNLWLGTTKGLSRYSGDRFNTFTSDDGLAGNHVLSVYCSKDGKLWIGTLTNGLSMFDGNLFRNYGIKEGLKSKSIWHIAPGMDNDLWLSTTSGPVLFKSSGEFQYPVSFLNSEIIYFTLQADTGSVYFATDKGLFIRENSRLTRIGAKNGLTEEKVRCLFLDQNRNLWIGTLRGLFVMKNDSVYNASNEFNFPQVPVTGILSDKNGKLIISTFDFGIYIINKNSVESLNRQNGLYSTRINRIFLDENNLLWMATPEGVDCFNWSEYVRNRKFFIIHFDKSNGYFGNETNSICADTAGNIWFGTINGVIQYNRRSGFYRASVPLLTLNKIQLFLKDVDWSKRRTKVNPRSGLPENLVLPFDQNNLSFYFTGIYLAVPDEVKYQFIMEGLDKDWSPVTNQPMAHYSNLPPGKFVFKVKATVNNRDWSPAVTFNFEIKPPVWKTPVFIFFYALALAIGIFLILQIRTRSLQRSQALLRKKVEDRTRELNEKNAELEKLSLVASETDNSVIIFNNNLELEWANKAYTRITGNVISDLNKDKPVTLYEISTHPEIRKLTEDAIRNKKSVVFESSFIDKQGREIWMSSTLNPIFNEHGQLHKVVEVDTDITYRKKMEEQITSALHEKGLLLKEIHHRVKNNLQIIISLFNLQSGFITDKEAYRALREGQDRIKSIALIHDRFYQAEGTSRIDFDEYIKRLCENLMVSQGVPKDKITLIIKADKIALDIDHAVPCGLIINEVINNSIRHAFPGERKGVIEIVFKKQDNHILLQIGDNGVGFSHDIDFENPETLGLQLIRVLAEQIDATVKLDNSNGVIYSISFVSH